MMMCDILEMLEQVSVLCLDKFESYRFLNLVPDAYFVVARII